MDAKENETIINKIKKVISNWRKKHEENKKVKEKIEYYQRYF